MKIDIFRGDLTDISAETEALLAIHGMADTVHEYEQFRRQPRFRFQNK